jgi:hypothetical protein
MLWIPRPSRKFQLRLRAGFKQQHAAGRQRARNLAKQRPLEILHAQNQREATTRQDGLFKIGVKEIDPMARSSDGAGIPHAAHWQSSLARTLFQNIQTRDRIVDGGHALLPRSEQKRVPPCTTRQIQRRPRR